MRIYNSYVFKDKDPEIQVLRTLIQDAHGGRLTRKTLEKIEDEGGPATATMHGWFFGKTMRPTNATLEAAGRALGYQRRWVKANGK
jgi:hypothetical protein